MAYLSKPMPVTYQGRTNDCGPSSIATVLSFYLPEPINHRDVAVDIRMWRIPWVGATLTRGIVHGLRTRGLVARAHWFGRLDSLRASIDADHPVIVLVRPTDLIGCPFYALHYRVLVGYNNRATLPGGGELYFGCSATPPSLAGRDHPGNVAVSYARFRRQWLTWASINWYTVAYPGEERSGPQSSDA